MNTFAIVSNTKKRIHADECDSKRESKFAKGHFRCIDCGNDVFVRRGQKRVWHFAHFQEDDARKCPHANGGETLEHYQAKHFIANNINKCAFAIERCSSCKRFRYFVSRADGRALFVHQCNAEVEKMVPGTKRVADVAIMHPNTGKVMAAIEVLHTHEVDANKWKECASVGVPILEVTTDEFQRVRGAWDESSLLQMVTTHMKFTGCDECVLELAWRQELGASVAFEMWYKQIWERYDPQKAAPITQVASKAPYTHKDVLSDMTEAFSNEQRQSESYESWYEATWRMHWRKLDALKKYNKVWDERKSFISKGKEKAEAQIQNANARNKVFRGRSCVTKCKGCAKWVFDDNPDDVEEVESKTMQKTQWRKLFQDDPARFRKKYMRSDGEFNFIYVHSQCAMECPSCQDVCLVQHLAKFGICVECSMYYKDKLNKLEGLL